MSRLMERLDKLTERMIDIDSLLPSGKVAPLPLKTIFDNLRYYTVLGFMWLGVRILRDDETILSLAAALVLALVVLFLGVLVALQTSAIAFVVVGTTFYAVLNPRQAVALRRKLRANNAWVKAATWLLVAPVIAAMVSVSTALFKALSRAGLL